MERSITHEGPGSAPDELKRGYPGGAGRGVGVAGSGFSRAWVSRLNPTWLGLGLVVVCLLVYYLSQPNRWNPYLHFVLQAQAWLDGQISIPMPQYQDVMPILDATGQATGRGIIPFPPLPAWVLLPFVAVWHEATNQQLLAAVFGALDVGLAWWMLGYLPIPTRVRWMTALFLGLGTVLWYAAVIGTTWFFAHVVAVGALCISVGLALSADREASEPSPVGESLANLLRFEWPGGWPSAGLLVASGAGLAAIFGLAAASAPAAVLAGAGVIEGLVFASLAVAVGGRTTLVPPILLALAVGGLPALLILGGSAPAVVAVADVLLAAAVVGLWWLMRTRNQAADRLLLGLWLALSRPELVQVAAGIFFGLAVTARLTILLGFPFLVLVGGGGSWLRRGLLAGAGAAIPLVALLIVTYATSGRLFNPAYDYLYHLELAYPFGYHADWSISDVRYIPQNLGIMFLNQPWWFASENSSGQLLCAAGQARGLFDVSCPLAMPNPIGMSIILSSPAWLLAPLAWLTARMRRLDRATVGASLAVAGIAVANLMHFSQGWVQFGYRFSNDFAPFGLVLVALGASRIGRLWPVAVLVAASVAINFWGTMWGVNLGW